MAGDHLLLDLPERTSHGVASHGHNMWQRDGSQGSFVTLLTSCGLCGTLCGMAVTDKQAAGRLGDRLKAAREARKISLRALMVHVDSLLPLPLWVTDETLRRYETGFVTEEKADPIIVQAVARALGVSVEDLSPSIAIELNQLRALLGDPADNHQFGDNGSYPHARLFDLEGIAWPEAS